MSEATDELTRAFWAHPELRQTAQLAIAEIDVLTARRDACLAFCHELVDGPPYIPDGDADAYWETVDKEGRRIGKKILSILRPAQQEKPNA